MNEQQRRRIARKFLEERFGKRGRMFIGAYDMVLPVPHNFELNKVWKTTVGQSTDARAFEVVFAPYVSGTNDNYIAVSDSMEELREIADLVFSEERKDMVDYDTYGNYYIAYD